MKNLMNLAVAVAILAVPAMGFAQNIDNAANLSQSAVSAGSLEASRDLATKALESIKLESATPVSAGPAISASRINLKASPVMAQVKKQKNTKIRNFFRNIDIDMANYRSTLSDMTEDNYDLPDAITGKNKNGFFGMLGAALLSVVTAPALVMCATGILGGIGVDAFVTQKTGSRMLGIMAGIPAGVVCAGAGLLVGGALGLCGLMSGTIGALVRLSEGKL